MPASGTTVRMCLYCILLPQIYAIIPITLFACMFLKMARVVVGVSRWCRGTLRCTVRCSKQGEYQWRVGGLVCIIRFAGRREDHISLVSCQKGPTRHGSAWQIRPYGQDTLDIPCIIHTGPCFNIKTTSRAIGSHYQDEMVVRPSYLYNRNSYAGRTTLFIETPHVRAC